MLICEGMSMQINKRGVGNERGTENSSVLCGYLFYN